MTVHPSLELELARRTIKRLTTLGLRVAADMERVEGECERLRLELESANRQLEAVRSGWK